MSTVRALVIADGNAPDRRALDEAWPGWSAVDLVVAADGGARLAARLGLRINLWVGDGDSLGDAEIEDLRRAGVSIARAATDKDESDTELGLLAAVQAGASDITILGALGGERLDHALANVLLLAHPGAEGATVRLLHDQTRVRLLRGPDPAGAPVAMDVTGPVGDLVSLLPLAAVHGATTAGLAFPLRDADLSAGPALGLSNLRVATRASIKIHSGRLLVVESPATLAT